MRRAATAALLVVLVSMSSCSRIQHHFFGHTSSTRAGTLTITPPNGPAGTAFSLNAAGFRAGEPMTFEIDSPSHARFVGPSHVAGPDGRVASSYTPLKGDPAGDYPVIAVGSRGTRATGHITVVGG